MAVPANWRLLNIDLLDPDSSANFDTSTLAPASQEGLLSQSDIQSLGIQIRQVLRGGDSEGALKGALGVVGGVYGGDDGVKYPWIQEPLRIAHTVCLHEFSIYNDSVLVFRYADSSWYGEQEVHLSTVVEILQSIKQADMSPMLSQIYASEGGTEMVDVLMKYLYKGMAIAPSSSQGTLSPQATGGFSQIGSRNIGGGGGEGGGQAMSVLLSWHEKVVEVAGLGCVVRAMCDRRTV
ncbi:MAG: hypothetical protein MMC33_001481 [Icmadophila ericetorum]|nr:hypothetical protein [Icmadophila ericetorum]